MGGTTGSVKTICCFAHHTPFLKHSIILFLHLLFLKGSLILYFNVLLIEPNLQEATLAKVKNSLLSFNKMLIQKG